MSEHHTQNEHHEPHVVSYGQYILIWLGLLALTATTVAVAGVDLGRWVIITALGIASIKTGLVCFGYSRSWPGSRSRSSSV